MNSFDQEIMARTAMGEARGEGDIGMQAVMWTGMNRFTMKKWFSAPTIAGTFLKKSQYDCWLASDPNYFVVTNLSNNSDLYLEALQWAAQVLQGTLHDPTLGATHYYADSIAAPPWTIGATRTIKIGRQSFYKNVA